MPLGVGQAALSQLIKQVKCPLELHCINLRVLL
jgi:hypothetical protein